MAYDLLIRIEECRTRMITLALQSSFANAKVVEVSNELDRLLNQFQHVISKE
ncbi:Spo0E family sporulation regulatory protein-aspartic acid phosphatase [Rossellomorea sp. BNER]|uniref:Spo0E family sporulation regulatory protein-aspartic acid phosphatase n=1 Tax=Rossellomorea sp. BNER TaxID=2962031 RepID=UPI003AF22B28